MSTNLNANKKSIHQNYIWNDTVKNFYEKVINDSFARERALYSKLNSFISNNNSKQGIIKQPINTVADIVNIFNDETLYNNFMKTLYYYITDIDSMDFIEIFTTQAFATNALSAKDKGKAKAAVRKGEIVTQGKLPVNISSDDNKNFNYKRAVDYTNRKGQITPSEYMEDVIETLANRILVLTPIQEVFDDLSKIQGLSNKLDEIKKVRGKKGDNFYNAFIQALRKIVIFNQTNINKEKNRGSKPLTQETVLSMKEKEKRRKKNKYIKKIRQYTQGPTTPNDTVVITMSGYLAQNQPENFEEKVVNAVNKILGKNTVAFVGAENIFYANLKSEYTEAMENLTNKESFSDNDIKGVVDSFSKTLRTVYQLTTSQLYKKDADKKNKLDKAFDVFWGRKGWNIVMQMLKQENDARKNNNNNNNNNTSFEELLKNYSSFEIIKIMNDNGFKGEVGEFFTQIFFRGAFGEKSVTATLGKKSFGTGPAAIDVVSIPNIEKGLKQMMGIQVKNFPSVYSRGNIHIYAQSSKLINQSRYLGTTDLQKVEDFVRNKKKELKKEKIFPYSIEENILKILVKHIPEYLRYDELGKKDDDTIIYKDFNTITSNFYMLNFRLYPASYIFSKIKEALSDQNNWALMETNESQMFHFDNEETKFDKQIAEIKGPLFLDKWEATAKNSIDDKNLFDNTYLDFSGLQIYFDRQKMKNRNANIVSLIIK